MGGGGRHKAVNAKRDDEYRGGGERAAPFDPLHVPCCTWPDAICDRGPEISARLDTPRKAGRGRGERPQLGDRRAAPGATRQVGFERRPIGGGLCAVHVLVELRFHVRTHHRDRKSTRLNSSHLVISYAVFCLKKKI